MMQKKYGRLSFNDRIETEKLLSHNKNYAEIARCINRSKSTLQREVIKQGITHYKALEGERLAVSSVSNRRDGKTKMSQCANLEKYVLKKLQLRWSPRQISISLQRKFPENTAMQVSHEAIYMYVYLHSKKGVEKPAYIRTEAEKKVPW